MDSLNYCFIQFYQLIIQLYYYQYYSTSTSKYWYPQYFSYVRVELHEIKNETKMSNKKACNITIKAIIVLFYYGSIHLNQFCL